MNTNFVKENPYFIFPETIATNHSASLDQITFLSLCLEKIVKAWLISTCSTLHYAVSIKVLFFTILAPDSPNSQENNTDELHCGEISIWTLKKVLTLA